MPVTLSYPGVYIEELPSGVRTITGVATSITAFIGRAVMGPTDQPVTIFSYGDFERTFGKMHPDYPLAYSVRDFFQNGGGQAVIVRLYKGTTAASALITWTSLALQAANKGAWGNDLRVRVETNDTSANTAAVAARWGLAATDLFNLTVRNTKTGASETFLNLTTKESPRRVDRVLAAESTLLRATGTFPSNTRPNAHAAPGAGLDNWTDDNASSKVQEADKAVDSADLTSSADYGSEASDSGLYALKNVDLFNLLCIPPDDRNGDLPTGVNDAALAYCVKRRAMLIIDPPTAWVTAGKPSVDLATLNLSGDATRNAAVFFPRILQADPQRDGQIDNFVPCGVVAGIMARTDASRGVWKAPAGLYAGLNGVQGLTVNLNDAENGQLNPIGVNCLRSFPVAGRVVWGSRTLRGADLLADEYKYIPVRRLALFLEESLYRGTQWAVFEPNDEPLWAQLRLNLGAFMHNLFRQGAFQGSSAKDAYFVKCDKDTTTQNDINLGIVNVIVGFAPLKPAEFVVIKLQQIAGQISV